MLKSAGVDADAAAQMGQGRTALEVIDATENLDALNLKGITLDNALYYINSGIPVIGRIGVDRYVLFTAYDSKNVTYIDAVTGAAVTETLTDAAKECTQWGNVFITYSR